MKYNLIVLLLVLFSGNLLSQEDSDNGPDGSLVGTIGFMQGGRSLAGLDIEYFITDKFGVQVGLGLLSAGAALNYHFKPTIRGTHLSFFYNIPSIRLGLNSENLPAIVPGRQLTGVSVVHRFRDFIPILSIELGAAILASPGQVFNQQGFIISPVIAVGVYKFITR